MFPKIKLLGIPHHPVLFFSFYSITAFFIHFLFVNRITKIKQRTAQSVNIAYHTLIVPSPTTRQRKIQSATLQHHMEIQDTVIGNFTSPAARKPYGNTKDNAQKSGFTIVIA